MAPNKAGRSKLASILTAAVAVYRMVKRAIFSAAGSLSNHSAILETAYPWGPNHHTPLYRVASPLSATPLRRPLFPPGAWESWCLHLRLVLVLLLVSIVLARDANRDIRSEDEGYAGFSEESLSSPTSPPAEPFSVSQSLLQRRSE